MLKTPVLLGFSMASRHNRRLLVAITYVTLLLLILTLSVLRFRSEAMHILFWLLIAIALVSRGVFGSMVKQTLLIRRWDETIGLGLAPLRNRDEDEPDERELAVRNAAYYVAYRVLALYCFIFVPYLISVPFLLNGAIAALVLPMIAMPLLVLALTLPQAVVLWTEPDVPEEARA